MRITENWVDVSHSIGVPFDAKAVVLKVSENTFSCVKVEYFLKSTFIKRCFSLTRLQTAK